MITKYSSVWEKTRAWLKRGKNPCSAQCNLCNKEFSVSGGGVSQVISHKKLQNHQKAVRFQTQSQLKVTLKIGEEKKLYINLLKDSSHRPYPSYPPRP